MLGGSLSCFAEGLWAGLSVAAWERVEANELSRTAPWRLLSCEQKGLFRRGNMFPSNERLFFSSLFP